MINKGNGRRIAIVIGTNDYLNMDKLKFAENDAKEMGEVLLDQNICGFDDVIELIHKTKEEASHKIEKVFKSAKENDEILIYFSGYGKPSYKFDLCLIFKDTDPESLLATSLKLDDINEYKDQSACNRVVIILDCCYSRTANTKGDFLQEMLSTFSGLGTVLLTSTVQLGSNVPKEDKKLKHGVFTYYLLKGLKDWVADYNNDRVITINELYRYTFNEIKAKGLPLPQIQGSYEGEMILGRSPQKMKETEQQQGKEEKRKKQEVFEREQIEEQRRKYEEEVESKEIEPSKTQTLSPPTKKPEKFTKKPDGSSVKNGLPIITILVTTTLGIFLLIGVLSIWTDYGEKDSEEVAIESGIEKYPEDAISPKDVAISPDGKKVYVTNSAYPTFSIIDTDTNTVTAMLNVGDLLGEAAVNPNGETVYVTNWGNRTVSIIDIDTNTVMKKINVGGGPSGVAVDPEGTKVYVTNSWDNTVSVIDTATDTVIVTMNIGSSPEGVVVSPDGTKAYVTNSGDDTVSVIDTVTNEIISTVSVGYLPSGVAISPDGKKVYVTNNIISGTVSVIDTKTNNATAKVPVGNYPYGAAVSLDGTKVYVTNIYSSTVSVIETANNVVTTTVDVGLSPHGVVVAPDGRKVYIANSDSNNISIIDTATDTVTATVDIGGG